MSTPVTDLIAFTIDTSDAGRLARFYAGLTGADITAESPEFGYAQITYSPHTINFQTVAAYAAPSWPGQEHPQQFHLDFRVGDLGAAVERAEELGATQATEQPAPEAYRVMIDPDGHPFCLCPPAPDPTQNG